MKGNSATEALRAVQKTLEQAGIEDAQSSARLLVGYALGRPIEKILAQRAPLSNDEQALLTSAVAKRLSGVPVQYITGRAYFYGLPLSVSPAVLIPRMDTETLVQAALEKKGRRVLDVGTGSGCIALAIQQHAPAATVVGVDISGAALCVARQNAADLGLPVSFIQGDLLAPVKGQRFDVIVSNPPYITTGAYKHLAPLVRDQEPALALLAGKEGLDVYKRLIPPAYQALEEKGWLLVEIGDTQQQPVEALFKHAGFCHIESRRDLAGRPRVVLGQKGRYHARTIEQHTTALP